MAEKIKITYIISHLNIGGAQTLVFDILNYLKTKDDLSINIITIDSGSYIERFKREGIEIFDLGEKGLVNVNVFLKLKKLLKELKPDIVHTHMLKADFYGRIAAKITGVPVIYSTTHNYSSHHKGADVNKTSIFDRIDDLVISYSKSNLIAISEVVRQFLINRKSSYDKVTEVIYNGVNIEREKYKLNQTEQNKLRKDLDIADDDFVIVISGRLDTQKGHHFLLDSVKEILKEKKNIKILIIGDGNLKDEIESTVRVDGLSDYVKLLGFQVDCEKFIEISDLICVPSLWEGFGLVIIEGMIKGKIVLASNTGGIPEIIEDGKTGFLFEVNDKNSFLKKFNFIYDNFTELDYIKGNASELVKEKFDIQKNSELYYRSYMNKIKILNR